MNLPQRVAYVLAAAVLILGGGWWVFSPTGHLRAFDADLQPLAESALEGYCTGYIFISLDQGRNPHPAETAECRATEEHPATVDMQQVVPMFCHGAVTAGWSGTTTSCKNILNQASLWPTLHGQLTAAWNKAHPYPGGEFTGRVTDGGDNTGRGQTR